MSQGPTSNLAMCLGCGAEYEALSGPCSSCGRDLASVVQDPAARMFVIQSIEGLRHQMGSHSAAWHIDEAVDWALNQDEGEIVFALPGGLIARAPAQIIGTFDTVDGTFLWGWDHPSVLEPLRQHALLARSWGEEHRVPQYTSRKLTCTEIDAWEFSAVTARVAGANGVYRGPNGTVMVFMTFGEIQLSKDT
jgi:hypothetical protein